VSLWKKREERALPTSIDPYQISARPYFPNYSGEIVTETSAFAVSAVLASVTLIADSVASMPLELTRDRGGRIEKLPTPSVLIRPNSEQTMFEFVHQMVVTLALHGTDYVYAPRRAGELPLEMRNIHPHKVAVVLDDEGNEFYKINQREYLDGEIRAIHWLRLPNQRRSISPLEALRNTIGMSIAMDRFLSQFYGEGATPSSVLETDTALTKEQAELIRQQWEDSHYKHRRPAVLTSGLKWRPILTSAADMEMLGHREALVRDIARAYRIPLHMINGSGGDSQTYQNVESAGINFVRYTLLPWLRRVEDALSEMLPLGQKVRFNTDEFQRADLLTRVRAQQIQISSGTLTPNEARAIENKEPFEGGDKFVMALPVSDVAATADIGTDAEPPQ
jgi:HK97 family phage portal protein